MTLRQYFYRQVVTIRHYGELKLNELKLLGQGTQGRVYRINDHKCIKIFKSRQVCSDEFKTLMMAQGDLHFPKLYGVGENYIIRECINGIELNRYLRENPMTQSIALGIIGLYESLIKVGYSRLDTAIFHIFITPTGELKLIDTSKALKKSTAYPGLILRGLEEVGCREEFLRYVKLLRPELINIWNTSIYRKNKSI